jgi:uncharacterized membrane protein YdjX (TVP38/TMEM64 family)
MLGASALVVMAALMAFVVPAANWTEVLQQALEEKNLPQALMLFCAVYVVGTLLMVPAWIFPIAAGAAFGFGWGLAASLGSATLAALAAYLIARHVARARFEKLARKSKTFAAVDQAVRKEPVKVVALLRLAPVLPSGLKSYFLGLTCVAPLPYVLASAAGMLPGIALRAWLGHLGRGVFDSAGPWTWAALAFGVAATVALAVIASRIAKRRLGF